MISQKEALLGVALIAGTWWWSQSKKAKDAAHAGLPLVSPDQAHAPHIMSNGAVCDGVSKDLTSMCGGANAPLTQTNGQGQYIVPSVFGGFFN